MSDLFDKLENRRAIIDRRALSARLDEIAGETSDTGKRRRAMVDLLKEALEAGRAEIELRLLAHPSSGRVAANSGKSSSPAASPPVFSRPASSFARTASARFTTPAGTPASRATARP